MNPAAAINDWVFNGDMEGIQQVAAHFERPAEQVDGGGAAAPEPVDGGGAAAPEPVAEVADGGGAAAPEQAAEEADGGGEEAEAEEEDRNYDAMYNIYKMLYSRVEVNGEMRTCCLDLTLETAKAIMAEFEKPGACYDDEAAHSNEDAINAAFIRGVARGQYTLEEAQEIAQLISGIGRMGFARWCA